MLPTVPPVHGDAIVIDLCSFFFEGYSQQMERGRPTALLVTAADVEAEFGDVVDSLELHHRQVEADPDRLLLIARSPSRKGVRRVVMDLLGGDGGRVRVGEVVAGSGA